MQLTDLPIAMLYILAVASVGIYGIVLAGWCSGSTYPLLGGLRSCAQMISYEIAMGAAFASVFLYSGSMSTSTIVEAQADRWYILLLPVSFIIYVITMVGETTAPPSTCRSPRATWSAASTPSTRPSSSRSSCWPSTSTWSPFPRSRHPLPGRLAGAARRSPRTGRAPTTAGGRCSGSSVKVQLLLFFFIWLRGTLPRVRYDQLMKLGWKVLIPVSVVWLMLVATVRALRNENYDFQEIVLYVGGGVIAILLLSFVADLFRDKKREGSASEEAEQAAAAEPFDPLAGGFPVPPQPGQHLAPVPRRRPRAGSGS